MVAQRLWHRMRQFFVSHTDATPHNLDQNLDQNLDVLLPGLYTYRVLPDTHGTEYGQKRLHLRVEQDGSGVLFIDVNDVIHLNASATHITRLALEGVPRDTIIAHFRRTHHARHYAQIATDVAQLYGMVQQLTTHHATCPTCAVGTAARYAPLFSTNVQAPYRVDIALTYQCNNMCSHCYNEKERCRGVMFQQNEWHDVLDRVIAIGVPHIIFTGGEATLHPLLPELIRYADERGAIVGLNTNGRRMADAGFVKTLLDAGLNHVQITLADYRAEQHNAIVGAHAYEQTVAAIRNALAQGLHTITNTTLTRRMMTAHDIEAHIQFLYALGVRTIAMNSMIAAGGGRDSPDAITLDELYPILIQVRDYTAERGMRFLWYTPTEYCRLSPVELDIGAKRCSAAEYAICIEPDGAVLPCQSYYVSAGNILHDRWEDIWHSALFRSFRERTTNPHAAGLPERCWHCPDLSVCGGGCRLDRE